MVRLRYRSARTRRAGLHGGPCSALHAVTRRSVLTCALSQTWRGFSCKHGSRARNTNRGPLQCELHPKPKSLTRCWCGYRWESYVLHTCKESINAFCFTYWASQASLGGRPCFEVCISTSHQRIGIAWYDALVIRPFCDTSWP